MTAECVATLRAFHANFVNYFFSDSVTATVATLALAATVLAVVVAPVLLHRYAGQMRRLMLLQQVANPAQSWVARRDDPAASTLRDAAEPPSTGTSAADIEDASAARFAAIRRATWIAYAAFVIPAPAFLLTATHALADIIGFCAAAPLLAAVPAVVNVRPEGSKTLVLAGMVVLGVILGITEPGAGGVADAVLVASMLGALYVVIAHRKLRSVIVLMTVWLTAALLGALGALWLASPTWLCPSNGGPAEWLVAASALAIAAAVFTAFVYAGREAMRLLSELVERGFLSDISLASAGGLTFVAVLLGFAISMDGPLPKWQIALVIGVWLGETFGWYAWALRGAARPTVQRSLLILRVFSNTRATERILDAVQTRWRYVGPVYEIAGPDLARLNIHPDEFYRFVSSRLYEKFYAGVVEHQHLAAPLARVAGRDGRFSVNQVFCFESAWQATVAQLMKISDVVVLDLHGYSAQRRGTGIEIDLLAREGHLGHVLAVGNASTDWDEFDRHLQREGCEAGAAARLQVAGEDSAARIVTALIRLASRAGDDAAAVRASLSPQQQSSA
jgi:hypothetical protein